MDHFVHRSRDRGKGNDASTQGHIHLQLFHLLSKGVVQLLNNKGCAVLIGIAQQDCKLVTAQPTDQVCFADGGLKGSRHDPQQMITRPVTQAVINLFEAIQSDICQADRTFGPIGSCQFRVDLPVELTCIGSARQVVGLDDCLRSCFVVSVAMAQIE